MRTIALTGFDGGEARQLADVAVHVDNRNYGVIEDAHQAVMHALAQYIRQLHMDEDAVAAQTF
jgi:D-sedoheptulose 7-phosphate isomerase/D-glycero-D-manno-heptose 1,7-bisphosphate phosphatase